MSSVRNVACILALSSSLSATAAMAADELPLTSPLNIDEVIATVMAVQPGEIAEFALDRDDGKVVIDIEVVTASGEEVEFQVDARTGEILKTWIDDDPTDDPGASDASDSNG